MNKIAELQKIINDSDNIVFFGGAGTSTESGIPDFRSKDGIYNEQYEYAPEEIVSHHFFVTNPEYFYKFYFERLVCISAKPNDCHKKLTELENVGKLKAIITQNIDNLHEDSGSKKVLHLHGSIMNYYCMKCNKHYYLDELEHKGVPKCSCGAIIKPDVVLYEEPLDNKVVEEAIKCISEADTLIIGGTSLSVEPAASFINYFHGKNLVIINKSQINKYTDHLIINEAIGQVFKRIKLEKVNNKNVVK